MKDYILYSFPPKSLGVPYGIKNLNNKLELKQAAAISKALGRKTIGAITLLGKNKLLKIPEFQVNYQFYQ